MFERMNFKGKAFYLLTSFGEHLGVRALDALLTILLIRSLSVDSLGVYAVYQSWVGILLLFFPPLENILYREYGQLKASSELPKEFSSFKLFNWFKFAAALVLVFACALPEREGAGFGYWTRFSAMGLAFLLPLSQAMYGIYRETLRFELKQTAVFILSVLQRVAVIALIYFISGSAQGKIEWFAVAVAIVCLIFGFIWSYTLKSLVPQISNIKLQMREAFGRISRSLHRAVLWVHFNGAITVAIQTMDVYFLSRAAIPLSEIAIYSIALKAANFFQVFSMPFAQILGVYLGRRSHLESFGRKRILFFTALFMGLSAVIFAVGWFSAEHILMFLAKGKFSSEEILRAKSYFLYQLAGVCVFIFCFAPGAYINSRMQIKTFTLTLFFPWFVLSGICYFVALKSGVLAMAQMNIPVYGVCFIGHLAYLYFGKRKNA